MAQEIPSIKIVRVEGSSLETLFHPLDPTPYPEKALSQEFIEYLEEKIEENEKGALRLEIINTKLPTDIFSEEALERALRWGIEKVIQDSEQEIKKIMRIGRKEFAYASMITIFCIFLAVYAGMSEWLDVLQPVFVSGTIVIGWVALWYPVEVLLFDWWPARERRLKFERLSQGEIHML